MMGLRDLEGLPKKQQVSAYIWLAWIGLSLAGMLVLFKVYSPPIYLLVAWGLFGLVYEIVATQIGHLTLSMVMQKIDDLAPQGVRWWQSYRGLANGLAATMSAQYAYIVSWADGNAWENWPIGLFVGLALFWWNHPHWTKPEKFG